MAAVRRGVGTQPALTSGRHVLTCITAIMAILLLCLSSGAKAADSARLRVPDMSSPRATLQGFLQTTDDLYTGWASLLISYLNSGELYPTAAQRKTQTELFRQIPNAVHALDLSEIPPVEAGIAGAKRMLQLRAILDRIELPPLEDVPDAAAMASQAPKRWRLPNTEIDFVLVQQGPRAGEYLVAPETVERLPEFYERVEDLPPRAGPTRLLLDVFHQFRPNSGRTIYDILSGLPLGLSHIIPLRWALAWPDWTMIPIGGVAIWQWIGVAITAVIAGLVIIAARRLATWLSGANGGTQAHRWGALLLPLAILLIAGVLSPLMCVLIRIGGTPRLVIAIAQTLAFYLSCAWLALIASAIAGEMIVGAEHLTIRSLDGQLIRLGSRLFGAAIAIGCVIQGADQLGFPAYSVLAGLGVGGLAVALAAKDSIANLLGSMMIMFEKPFRVGHQIRLAGSEGTVEDVGFRSTRIRTPDNSLISIPNDSVINTKVENLSLRSRRRQRFVVGVTYDTSRTALQSFVAGIRQLVTDHELVDPVDVHVRFNAFSDSSLDILVMFHLAVADYPSELRGREEILVAIMELAETLDVAFAFPTRTVIVEQASSVDAATSSVSSQFLAATR